MLHTSFTMPVNGERRAEIDGRFESVEARVDRLEWGQTSVKRRLDEVTRSTSIVCEGAERMDNLCKKLCEDVPEGQKANWAKFEEEAAEALCKDLAEHLSCEWAAQADGQQPCGRSILHWAQRGPFAMHTRSINGTQRRTHSKDCPTRFCSD